jgi:hypothetical protein
MKSSISYKNCLIRGESFQREKNGKWIPQYTLTRQSTRNSGNHFPSQQYQLNELSRLKMKPTLLRCKEQGNGSIKTDKKGE